MHGEDWWDPLLCVLTQNLGLSVIKPWCWFAVLNQWQACVTDGKLRLSERLRIQSKISQLKTSQAKMCEFVWGLMGLSARAVWVSALWGKRFDDAFVPGQFHFHIYQSQSCQCVTNRQPLVIWPQQTWQLDVKMQWFMANFKCALHGPGDLALVSRSDPIGSPFVVHLGISLCW